LTKFLNVLCYKNIRQLVAEGFSLRMTMQPQGPLPLTNFFTYFIIKKKLFIHLTKFLNVL